MRKGAFLRSGQNFKHAFERIMTHLRAQRGLFAFCPKFKQDTK